MVAQVMNGPTPLERLHRRYEATDKKCSACGYVDEGKNWTGKTNGREIVYEHVCPSCDAERDYTYRLA